MTSEHESPLPSIYDIRNKTQQFFGVRPCLWQIRVVVQEILKGERDVVSIAETGMGKTLTFWMPQNNGGRCVFADKMPSR